MAEEEKAATAAEGDEEEDVSDGDDDDAPLPAMRRRAAASDDDEEEDLSDGDDAPLPSMRRRVAASDDDEEDGSGGGGGSGSPPPSRASDSDSDDLGAAEVYGEDEGSEECEEVREESDAGFGGGGEAKEVAPDEFAEEVAPDEVAEEVPPIEEVAAVPEDEGECEEEEEAQAETGAELKGEEKENEGFDPDAVPRTGAFYMHDDRFQVKENHPRRRPREFLGAQKLWNSKDDSVWLHDRFDEMNIHDVQHENTRRPFRAWPGGRAHDVNHGYLEGTKSASYYHDYREDYKHIPKESLTHYESTKNYNRFPKETNASYYNAKNYRSVPRKSHSYYDEKNFYSARRESHICYVNAKGYNNAPNVNRGKPSMPCQPHWKNTFETFSVQNNRTYSRSQNEEGCSDTGMGKNSGRTLSFQDKQEFPSKQELPFTERRKARPDIFSKLFSSSVRMAHSSLKPQPRPSFRVKAFVPSGEHGNCAGSLSMVKGMPNLGSHSSASTSNSQYSRSRDQGSGLNIGGPTKNKLSSADHELSNAVYQQRSAQQSFQPTPRESTQMFHQNIASTNNIQSHQQNAPISSTEDAETNSPPSSNNSLAPSVVITQNDNTEAVSGSFPCGGGGHALDVIGAKGLTLGTPVLPVMKFSGQHPRGPDITSTGMALPGLLAHQPSGNSEISQNTWLQTSSGATGVLGATYNPCYIGSYYLQPLVTPRNHCVTEVPVLLNSPEIPEVLGHELGQRKNKLLRYSEMNFAS